MTTTFNPEFAEILSEAFANCGIRPSTVTTEHIDEAIRSSNLALLKFSNLGVKQYNLVQRTITTVSGQASYSLPQSSLDVWSAVLTRDNADTPIWPIGRTDYQNIPKKTQLGKTYNYFVDRGKVGTTQRTIYVWPVPDRSTDIISYWSWERETDQTDMNQTAPIAYEWIDAYACEIAARMAKKFAPDRFGLLKQEAKEAFVTARMADRERAPVRFKFRGYIKQRAG
jgi:hypothetical protein